MCSNVWIEDWPSLYVHHVSEGWWRFIHCWSIVSFLAAFFSLYIMIFWGLVFKSASLWFHFLSNRYVWQSTEWGSCSVDAMLTPYERLQFGNDQKLCGGGVHQRDVFCTMFNDTGKTDVSIYNTNQHSTTYTTQMDNFVNATSVLMFWFHWLGWLATLGNWIRSNLTF